MPRISIIADADFIAALSDDAALPMTKRERFHGTQTESERLGFELGSVETLIGHIAAGVELVVIVHALATAALRSRRPKLEIASPTGRVSVDLSGKTDEEVAALVRATLPFTR